MAVLEKIRALFVATDAAQEAVVPAAPTAYEIRPLTDRHLNEVSLLNQRCFGKGENYTKYTFSYLFSEPNTLSYRVAAPAEEIVAFIFITVAEDGAGHVTTVGVAPEHRRRGLAQKLLRHAEEALKKRGVGTIFLEVRVGNLPARRLYERLGYAVVQQLNQYYNSGEDAFLMVKSLS